MLNLFNSIKIFNLINLFTFLGQGGQPGRMQQGRVGVTGILDTPLGVDNVPVSSNHFIIPRAVRLPRQDSRHRSIRFVLA